MRTLKFFITGILCLTFSIQTIFAQSLNTKISIKVKDATLPQVLQQIQKKYGYRFSYLNNELPTRMKFSAEIKNQLFSEVLDVLLERTDLGYKQINGQIIIKKGFPKNKPKTTTFQKLPTPTAATEKTVAKTSEKPAENKTAKTETPKPQPVKTEPAEPGKNIAVIDANAPENTSNITVNTSIPADENVKDTVTVIKMEGQNESIFDKLVALRRKNEQKATNVDTIMVNDVHLGIFPPVSTNGTEAGKYINELSAHLLVGRSAALEGLEFSGFGNIERSYVSGAQFAGYFNIAKNSLALEYLANERNEGYTLHGAQFAGFFNLANGNVKGGQFAGYMNVAAGHMQGAQFAGFLNITKNIYGVQGAGYMNLAKNVDGAQLAGFLNIADTVSGVQAAGFLNVAKTVKGSQLGFINIADSVSGVAIGVFSFVDKGGYKRAEFYYSDDFDANFAFKLGMHKFYSFVALGAELNDKNRWGYGFGFGREWQPTKRFHVNTDLMAYNVIEESFEDFPDGFLESDELNLLNKFRLLGTLQITNRVAIFGGPVYNVFVSKYQEPGSSEIGSQLVTNTFYNHTSDGGTNVKMWLGFNAGVRF